MYAAECVHFTCWRCCSAASAAAPSPHRHPTERCVQLSDSEGLSVSVCCCSVRARALPQSPSASVLSPPKAFLLHFCLSPSLPNPSRRKSPSFLLPSLPLCLYRSRRPSASVGSPPPLFSSQSIDTAARACAVPPLPRESHSREYERRSPTARPAASIGEFEHQMIKSVGLKKFTEVLVFNEDRTLHFTSIHLHFRNHGESCSRPRARVRP